MCLPQRLHCRFSSLAPTARCLRSRELNCSSGHFVGLWTGVGFYLHYLCKPLVMHLATPHPSLSWASALHCACSPVGCSTEFQDPERFAPNSLFLGVFTTFHFGATFSPALESALCAASWDCVKHQQFLLPCCPVLPLCPNICVLSLPPLDILPVRIHGPPIMCQKPSEAWVDPLVVFYTPCPLCPVPA